MRSQTYLSYKLSIIATFFVAALGYTSTVKAQLNPLASQYFQNQYLFNPAMAGINQGLNINLDYSKQGLSVAGTQTAQAVSADYQMDRVGLGFSANNQVSGLFRSTRAVVTYAYHLPLGGDNQKLNFGLSGGVVNHHLETSNIIGDQSDLSIAQYNNNNPTFIDGDFGAAYTSNRLTIQGALPNLKTLFKDNGTTIENEVFYTAASYKLGDPKDMSLEPLVAYRKVKGFTNIVDAGANLTFNDNAFSVQGFYHSSNSATFGFGVNMAGYSLLAFYTTNTTTLNAYSNGDFEVSLKFNLFKK